MRRSLATIALALSGLHAGCSALLDYSAFQSAGDDASVPADSGAVDAGATDAASPTDAAIDAGTDASRPDASIPTDCETYLGDSYDILLGEISELPSPVTNLPFDVLGNVAGEVGLAWVSPLGVARLRAWSVDAELGEVVEVVPEIDAVEPVDTTLGSISLARSATGWVVLGRAGIGGRAATCVSGECTGVPLDDGAGGPFTFAQRDSDFVVVHTASGPSFTSLWRASTIPPSSTTDLATVPSSLGGIDAAGLPAGYVVLAGVEQSSQNRATFLWFDRPPAAGVQRTRSAVEPIGSTYVAYDAETETAIGVVSTLDGASARTHLMTAQRSETSAPTRATWEGTSGPVVSRGHGTFLVRDPGGYSLRATGDPASVLQQTGTPGGTSRPLVVAGRYAVLYINTGVPNEINLRVFPCR